MSDPITHYGVSAKIENLDKYYLRLTMEAAQHKIKPPTVINDIATMGNAISVSDTVDKMLMNRIVDEKLNSTPICSIDCEYPIAHRYNLGRVCKHCGYAVTEHRIESDVWMRAPLEMQYFINPRFWMLFNKNFGQQALRSFDRSKYVLDRGADLMMWMIDPYYKLPDQVPSRTRNTIMILEEFSYERGIENFIARFSSIMKLLTERENWNRIMKIGRTGHGESERERERWMRFLSQQSTEVFSRHLPVITSQFIVAEETRRGISVDPVFVGAVDAVKTIASIYTRQSPLDTRHLLSRSIKANRQMAYFYHDLRKETLSQKSGIYRSKVSSTFIPWSGRATISPISGPHNAWDLHAPWRWMVNLMAVDIENKLLKRGYSARQCERMLAYACMQYVEVVHVILKELIKESPGGKGIMVVMLRNPTLVQLSIQTFYITEVITDVNQCSIRLSVRVIKEPNADFDGDQLMVWRPVDQREMDLAMAYIPANGFMSATSVDEVASGMILHNEVISMQNSFLNDEEEDDVMGTPLEEILRLALQ